MSAFDNSSNNAVVAILSNRLRSSCSRVFVLAVWLRPGSSKCGGNCGPPPRRPFVQQEAKTISGGVALLISSMMTMSNGRAARSNTSKSAFVGHLPHSPFGYVPSNPRPRPTCFRRWRPPNLRAVYATGLHAEGRSVVPIKPEIRIQVLRDRGLAILTDGCREHGNKCI